MSCKGNCRKGLLLGYNSPTERVFRSLKYEQLNHERFRTKEAAKLSATITLRFITADVRIQN